MFKFGFESSDQMNLPTSQADPDLKALYWLPSEEIKINKNSDNTENNVDKNEVGIINIGSEKLLCRKPSSVLCKIKNKVTDVDDNISLAENNHSDLVASKYEGGFKVWECTHDLADYLNESLVRGNSVMDLGCGAGLLGILALRLGADSVCFQDYNSDVLHQATIPNVLLNTDSQRISSCRFFSGDWNSFAELAPVSCDLVLTSETIYNPANHVKLHDCIRRLLKPTGVALVAAKTYYFGVGGSTRQFEKLVRELDVFNIEVVWKCSEGVQREILKLTVKLKQS